MNKRRSFSIFCTLEAVADSSYTLGVTGANGGNISDIRGAARKLNYIGADQL